MDGPPQGIKIHIHKVDGPYEGSRFTSTKWTDPTRDQYSCPQSERTPWGLTVWQSPQSGRTPQGIKIHIHKVDGPHTRDQDSHPQNGRTPRGTKIHIHKVDEPHVGSIFMSKKWTNPTRVNCLTKSTKWTDPTRDQYSAHKVDGPHKGLTVWLSPQRGWTPRGSNI